MTARQRSANRSRASTGRAPGRYVEQMQICTTGDLAIRTLGREHVEAVRRLEPGDLAQTHGEWICPRTGRSDCWSDSMQANASGTAIEAGIFRGGELLGLIHLRRLDDTARIAALGFALSARHRGQGVMSAACRAVIAHAFTVLQREAITISTDTGNHACRALAAKLGFTPSDRAGHWIAAGGERRDLVVCILHRAASVACEAARACAFWRHPSMRRINFPRR